MQLSKLKNVDLREVWSHETYDFTKWLFQEKNMDLLGNKINIDLEAKKKEANLGLYNVDILAEEKITNRKVVIENQLEKSDHDHLARLIMYAAGYDAEILIWIVKDLKEEHKKVIDWLNEHNDEEINIFAIEIELWQIESSSYAPNFRIICQPNNWVKEARKVKDDSSLTDTQKIQFKFWKNFVEYAQENDTHLKLKNAKASPNYTLSLGNSTAHLYLSLNTRKDELICQIYIPNSDETFDQLKNNKEIIEMKLDAKLNWSRMKNKNASRIRTSKNIRTDNEEKWPYYFEWLLEKAENFYTVFSSYL